MGRRHAFLFISERSRLPILIPVRQADRLRSVFPEAPCGMLASVGVRADLIERERSQMSQIVFGRTRSRSPLGSLNDFSMAAQADFITRRDDPLEDIARDLPEMPPILPFKGQQASAVMRASSTHLNDARETRSRRSGWPCSRSAWVRQGCPRSAWRCAALTRRARSQDQTIAGAIGGRKEGG
jgi:hypothetical protein